GGLPPLFRRLPTSVAAPAVATPAAAPATAAPLIAASAARGAPAVGAPSASPPALPAATPALSSFFVFSCVSVPGRKCGYRGHANAVGAWNISLAISGLAEAA
ncbi:hypothetical protein AB1398_02000, partial [Hydrogenibacillus schlegelii]